MKDRLVAAGFALAALLLFWALLFPHVGGAGDATPKPLSTERAGAGYLGLARWLAAERIRVLPWRGRYDGLAAAAPTPAAAPGGEVLITTMPHSTVVRRAELEQLDAWVRAGNTLVVMAALDDTPRWAVLAPLSNFPEQVTRIARIKISIIAPPDEDSDDAADVRAAVTAAIAPGKVELVPVDSAVGPHPMFAGVASVRTQSDLPASRWQAVAMDESPVLVLARRKDTGDPAVWLKPFGKGSVILSAFASPFSNGALGESGNARWLANILALALRPGGRVLLDDAHQGAVDFYDPRAFFADSRLHHALWWIVLVWFIYVVGAPYLRPATAPRAPVDDVAMLSLTARFYASALATSTAGTRLMEHFFNTIRRRRSLREDGAPVWDWLESQARVPADEVAALREFHDRATAGLQINLARLQATLASITGHLA